jgi:hypothetical protein
MASSLLCFSAALPVNILVTPGTPDATSPALDACTAVDPATPANPTALAPSPAILAIGAVTDPVNAVTGLLKFDAAVLDFKVLAPKVVGKTDVYAYSRESVISPPAAATSLASPIISNP